MFSSTVDDTWELSNEKASAEWIFKGKVLKEDYHKNMNGENFMKWVEKRLLVAFDKRYPDKKMILILDNAAYHHVRDERFIDPLLLKRAELIDVLISKAGKIEMTVVRDGAEVTFDLAQALKSKRGGKQSPTVTELRNELQAWLRDHQEYQGSRLRTRFGELGHSLIFTPPYTPAVQPIELTWSYVKWVVSDKFFLGRTVEETRKHIFAGFYGDGTATYPGYTSKLAKAHIEKCKRHCNYFIEEDERLSGTIDALVANQNPLTEDELLRIDGELEDLDRDDNTDTHFAAIEEDVDSDDETEIKSDD
jgi:transposase